MRRLGKDGLVVVLLGGLGVGTSVADAADRSPVEILREIDAIRLEDGDPARDDDPAYAKEFWKRQHERFTGRAELIGELSRVDPGNPRIATLLSVRWRALSGRLMGATGHEDVPALVAEVDQVLAQTPDRRLKVEAAYLRAWIVSDCLDRPGAAPDVAGKVRAVDAFLAFAPQDERGAELLSQLSMSWRDDPARQQALYERIVREYPNTSQAARARGLIAQAAAVGKPFDLTFRDAATGVTVATRDLRGKVIVVDFWATWCGPCVADLPRLKDLYARYHPQGVEFIGVSLDYPLPAGGIDKFRAFLTRNALPWPQYFQGNGFDSDFSTAAGITAVPTIFVVDRRGNLAAVTAGAHLEALIVAELSRVPSEAAAPGR